jgi:hypothetical protein
MPACPSSRSMSPVARISPARFTGAAPPRPPVAPSPDYQLPPSEYHPCRARSASYPAAIGLA